MSTRALLAPVLKIANAYSEAAKSSPISTAVATAGVQTWAADGIAQLAVEKREDLSRCSTRHDCELIANSHRTVLDLSVADKSRVLHLVDDRDA